MLVLCMGVLAVGIYAVKPTKNQISGTITIGATNEPVNIQIYQGNTSGTKVVDKVVRSGDKELCFGNNLTFKTISGQELSSANTLEEVAPIVYVMVLSTTSDKQFVVETETVQQFDAVQKNNENVVVQENAVSLTKNHSPSATDKATGKNGAKLAYFTKDNPYTITFSLKLGAFVQEECSVKIEFDLDIHLASEYEGEGINGVDYLYFGTYPQSKYTGTETLTPIEGKTFACYDDNGGETTRDVYQDTAGNEYVRVDNIYTSVLAENYQSVNLATTTETGYYLIEPLKWRILKNTDGTALLMCNTSVEQVYFRKNYENKTITIDGTNYSYYVAKNADGSYVTSEDELGVKGGYVLANNYKYSDLRNYLTNTFYNGAFNNLQKQLIETTTVYNDASTTYGDGSYVCENTQDKVFALSYADITNAEYNFKPYLDSSDNRIKDYKKLVASSDYSSASGTLYMSMEMHQTIANVLTDGNIQLYFQANGFTEEEEIEYVLRNFDGSNSCVWWCRSPYSTLTYDALDVFVDGNMFDFGVSDERPGCVPALRLSL